MCTPSNSQIFIGASKRWVQAENARGLTMEAQSSQPSNGSVTSSQNPIKVKNPVNMVLGWPSDDLLLPKEMLLRATNTHLEEINTREYYESMNYGENQGYFHTRCSLSDWLSKAYCCDARNEINQNDLMMLGGVSQGVDVVATTLCKPGDVVIVGEPTYFLMGAIFRDAHLKIEGVPVDAGGIMLDELEATLEKYENKEENIRMVYTIPIHHNPSGTTLSAERRQKLIQLAHKYDFIIAADEVYQLLSFGTGTPPVKSLCECETIFLESKEAEGINPANKKVISFGSFSKILGPGLRIGWIQCHNEDWMYKLTEKGFIWSGGGLNHFTICLMNHIIQSGDLDQHLSTARRILTDRGEALIKTIQENDPDRLLSFTPPKGGYFIWIKCPDGLSGADFTKMCKDSGVLIQCGSTSTAMANPITDLKQYVRLCFANQCKDDLVCGAKLMMKCLYDYKNAQ